MTDPNRQIELEVYMNLALGGSDSPRVCMRRLLALETLEDAQKVYDALEDGWEKDWAGAFGRAARQVLGLFVPDCKTKDLP